MAPALHVAEPRSPVRLKEIHAVRPILPPKSHAFPKPVRAGAALLLSLLLAHGASVAGSDSRAFAQTIRLDTLRLTPVRLDSTYSVGLFLNPRIASVATASAAADSSVEFPPAPCPSPKPTASARSGSLPAPTAAYRFDPVAGRLRLTPCRSGPQTDILPDAQPDISPDTLIVVIRSYGRIRTLYRLHSPIPAPPPADSTGRGGAARSDPTTGAAEPLEQPPFPDRSSAAPFNAAATSPASAAPPARLDQSGSITRGFSLGTSQDPVLTSALDLRLSGQLTESLRVDASLTDQSLPFQPDGATQTLNELDRVHIRLSGGGADVELGDVDLRFTGSRFTSLERRVQGMAASWEGERQSARAGLSIQRGLFHVQEIEPLEGVRGPYRLNGAYGESFITITAGTERVWLNGRRLERGSDADYVMDYGMAELTFTGNRILSSTDRIRVEFQYLNGSYTRTLFATGGGLEGLAGGRLDLQAFYVREADANEANRTPLLESIGDVPSGTLVSSADSVGLDAELNVPLYTRIDTLLNGVPSVIYRHIPGGAGNAWRVRFSDVGPSAGSYVRDPSAVNGLVYRWVGAGSGSYEPVIRLQAPESRHVLSTTARLKMGSAMTGRVEWAVSDVDLNRFSRIDDGDNIGHALLAEIRAVPIQIGPWTVRANASSRLLEQAFESPDPVRDREFERIWGAVGTQIGTQIGGRIPMDGPQAPDGRERLGSGSLRIAHRDSTSLDLAVQTLSRNDDEGYRLKAELRRPVRVDGGPAGSISGDLSRFSSPARSASYRREWLEGRIELPIGFGGSETNAPGGGAGRRSVVRPSLEWGLEHVEEALAPTATNIFSDSLTSGSLRQHELTPAILLEFPSFTLSGGWGIRSTDRALQGVMTRASQSTLHTIGLKWNPERIAIRTENRFTLLSRDLSPAFAATLPRPSRTVSARSLTQYGSPDSPLDGRLSWEAANELTPVYQEVYLFTGPEIGTHVWEDLNGDGIPSIDEFFPEIVEGEGVYALQLIPSDQVRPVTDVELRWTQTLRTPRRGGQAATAWNARAGSSPGEWEWRTDFRLAETSLTDDPASLYLLRPSAFQSPETTLTGRFSLSQHLVWTPDARQGTRLSLDARLDRALHTRGVGWERMRTSHVRMHGVWRGEGGTRFEHALLHSRNASESPGLLNRSYSIEQWSAETSARRTWTRSWQSELRTRLDLKRDSYPDEPVRARTSSVAMENRLSFLGRFRSLASVEWRHTDLQGILPRGASAWELTGGTGAGSAWVLALQASGTLSRGVRVQVRGTGRTSLQGTFRQTLEVSVNARF